MKKIILAFVFVVGVSSTAHAQWSDMLKNVQSSPLLAQQSGVQDIITKVQAISAAFSKMPFNSGKLEFIKAALPELTQVQSLSSSILALAQKGKPADPAQTSKLSGLLDQVKGLVAQKWSANALTAAQLPDANNQVQQLSGILANILKNEGDVLKSAASSVVAH